MVIPSEARDLLFPSLSGSSVTGVYPNTVGALKSLRSYFVTFAMKTEYGSIGNSINIPFNCL
jgi:hypothetical protein